MPKILYICDPSPDYGADFLYHGFCRLFPEPDSVIDWNPKDTLHWRPGMGEPLFDCYVDLPRHHMMSAEIDDTLASRGFDLIVLPTLRPGAVKLVEGWRRGDLLQRNAGVVVTFDGEDLPYSNFPHRHNLGFRPVAHFVRELPEAPPTRADLGTFTPLPFGYPAERIVEVGENRQGVSAMWHVWDWCYPLGSVRASLPSRLLYHDLQPHIEHRISYAAPGHRQRVSVSKYHDLNRQRIAAICPAGRGYFTNRLFEVVADGCLPIAEEFKGRVAFPDAFEPWGEALYFQDASECIGKVRSVIADPAAATAAARRAQAKLRAHHTTDKRAATVWKAVHGKLPSESET